MRTSTRIAAAVFVALVMLGAHGANGTLVKDIHPTGASSPFSLRNVGGTLFFTANDGTNGGELWRSDGTDVGTVMVKDINPGTFGAYPRPVLDLQGTLLFSANDGTLGYELWRSDGTDAGTALVEDIAPGAAGADPAELTALGGTAFFRAYVSGTGSELWSTDGTAAGTLLVSDINPGAADSTPRELTAVGNLLLFRADDGLPASNHRELWKSDGTAAGTVMVKDINPGPAESYPGRLIEFDGTLFFEADDGSHGAELWRSDGTAAGTVMVKDIQPGPGSGGFGHPTIVGDTLFFTANDGINGTELWKTDGTAAGTVLVKDINPSGSSTIVELQAGNGILYFAVFDDLWKSDGTADGTVLVKDLDSSNYPFALESLTVVNDTLFFAANDGVHGVEVWLSDGTEPGTVLAADVKPGDPFSSSWPQSLTAVDGLLLFHADDGTTGPELWSIRPSVPGTVPDGYRVPGNPLRLGKAPSDEVTLTWQGPMCATGSTDYAVYEGALGSFDSHAPLVCSTGGATAWSGDPGPGDRYYLVVPWHDGAEGSYGHDSLGTQRAQSFTACAVQSIGGGCY